MVEEVWQQEEKGCMAAESWLVILQLQLESRERPEIRAGL